MKKVLILDRCNDCNRFSSNVFGERCYHPRTMEGHPDKVSRELDYENFFSIEIPEWCPLDDYSDKPY